MSLDALTWAFGQDLDPARKIVLLALADYADDNGRCWPSQETMTAKTSLSVRSIRTHLRALEAEGLIVTTHRSRPDGGRSSNEYTLPLTPRQNLPGPPADRFRGPRQTAAGAPRQTVAGIENHHLEPPENPPAQARAHATAPDPSPWAGEECGVRREPRGPHELDADGLACVYCDARNPAVTAVERDAILARRKLTALHRNRSLPIDIDELLDAAKRLGNGDLLAGARAVEQKITEKSLDSSDDLVAVIRYRLSARHPRSNRARRVQAA